MMKKVVAALAILITTAAMAKDPSDIDPRQPFDATKKETNQTTVTWVTVDDVPKACRAMDQKYGTKMERGRAIACSFWTQSTCTIITSNHPNIESLGHEMRHCFQGAWHD
jgi:hypothetical protein